MDWTSLLLAGGIGVGGSLLGGMFGDDAAGDALKLQKKMAEQGRDDLKPWRKYGEKALEQLWNYIQDPSQVTEMPGYKFAFGEGTKALLRSAAATGGLHSGATGKALTRYGQDYATTNYLRYLQPYQQLSGAGQSAAAGTAMMGQNYANQASSNILAQGSARAGTVGNVTNALLGGIKDYYYMSEMEKLREALGNRQNTYPPHD